MIHKLKTWPREFEAVATGQKTFEYRKNDRVFTVGDILILREYNPNFDYTGRREVVKVIYLLKDAPKEYGLPKGYCIMQFQLLHLGGNEIVEHLLLLEDEITQLKREMKKS